MGMRSNWAKSFDPKVKELYPLEQDKELDLWLFQTKDKPNNDPLGRLPMYHVWYGDNWVLATENMRAAYNKYEQTRNELKEAIR